MKERTGTRKQALAVAVIMTLAAVVSLLAAVFNGNALQALATAFFTISALIWWNRYHIKQQEEKNHE